MYFQKLLLGLMTSPYGQLINKPLYMYLYGMHVHVCTCTLVTVHVDRNVTCILYVHVLIYTETLFLLQHNLMITLVTKHTCTCMYIIHVHVYCSYQFTHIEHTCIYVTCATQLHVTCATHIHVHVSHIYMYMYIVHVPINAHVLVCFHCNTI